MKNALIVNFKTYEQGSGFRAGKLAKICNKVAKKTGKNIILAVSEVDIHRISTLVDIPVYSEHLDPIHPGAHTGKNLPQALKDNGADGTLLNHSEDRFRLDQLEDSIAIAKEVGLKTVVCANNALAARAVAAFSPDMIAVEPPELIGGDTSISTAKPEVITDTIKDVEKVAEIPILCGAGVKTAADVKKAVELGSKGILVASGVVKNKDPEKALTELAEAL